jgi:micrococcal nuclease
MSSQGFAKKKTPPSLTLFGVVHHCHDGDTCTVISDTKKISVRFSGIDTPELAQKDGKIARDFTEGLIKGKEVKLVCDGTSFNRVTCTVFQNEININAEIVKAGMAFDVPQFSKGQYQAQMQVAQTAKLGIWKENPTSPYCFRHKKNKSCQRNPAFVGK